MAAAYVALAAAVIGGIGAYQSGNARKGAAARQEQLDKQNIELYKKEVGESVRRTGIENDKTESVIKTQIGASGFAVGSSLDAYLKTVQQENSTDLDWMRTSGASRVAISEREAAARKRNSDAQANANLVAGVGNAIGTGAGAFT